MALRLEKASQDAEAAGAKRRRGFGSLEQRADMDALYTSIIDRANNPAVKKALDRLVAEVSRLGGMSYRP